MRFAGKKVTGREEKGNNPERKPRQQRGALGSEEETFEPPVAGTQTGGPGGRRRPEEGGRGAVRKLFPQFRGR